MTSRNTTPQLGTQPREADRLATADLTLGQRIRMVLAASSGNLVEWFDFYVYSAFSIYFASEFFPSGNQTSQFLNTAGVFLAGFLARPVGGYFFGRLADRIGRKRSMILSVTLACVGSLMFAVLPTYGHGSYSVGGFAPVLMVLVRLLQGFAVGGEYGAAATYMTEIAPKERRGLFSSFQYVTLIGGQLLASLVAFIMLRFLTDQQMTDFGWRIPFVIGGIAAVVSFVLRRGMLETTTEADRNTRGSGTFRGVLAYRRSFWVVLGLTACGSLVFYAFSTYSKTYLVNTTGLSKSTAITISTVALAFFMCVQPLFGMLSDKIGRRNSMLLFTVLMALITVPVFALLKSTKNPVVLTLILCAVFAVMSLYTSIAGVVKAEMFPSAVRALGVGFTYAIGNSLFGGSAEYVALGLKKAGVPDLFGWYVVVLCVVGFIAAWFLWDNRHRNFMDHHESEMDQRSRRNR